MLDWNWNFHISFNFSEIVILLYCICIYIAWCQEWERSAEMQPSAYKFIVANEINSFSRYFTTNVWIRCDTRANRIAFDSYVCSHVRVLSHEFYHQLWHPQVALRLICVFVIMVVRLDPWVCGNVLWIVIYDKGDDDGGNGTYKSIPQNLLLYSTWDAYGILCWIQTFSSLASAITRMYSSQIYGYRIALMEIDGQKLIAFAGICHSTLAIWS